MNVKPAIVRSFAGRALRALSQRVTSPNFVRLWTQSIFLAAGIDRRVKPASRASVHRILVIRIDEIGDVVVTSGFFRELRLGFPKARIEVVLKPSVSSLMERCPYVDAILAAPRAVSLYSTFGLLRRQLQIFEFGRRVLWPRRYDLCLLPRWDGDAGAGVWFVYFSGAPWRVAYSEMVFPRKRLSDRDFDTLLTDPVMASDSPRHEVLRNFDILSALGVTPRSDKLEVWFDSGDVQTVKESVPQVSDAKGQTIAICLGAGSPKRCWPASRYAQVVAALLASGRVANVVVIGGPEDVSAGESFALTVGKGVLNRAGAFTLRETAAFLSQCTLYLGGDTGPMHMAAAAGAAVVCVSCHPMDGDPNHINAPERFGPWTERSRVVRPISARTPCKWGCEQFEPHCILDVDTARVIDACESILITT